MTQNTSTQSKTIYPVPAWSQQNPADPTAVYASLETLARAELIGLIAGHLEGALRLDDINVLANDLLDHARALAEHSGGIRTPAADL